MSALRKTKSSRFGHALRSSRTGHSGRSRRSGHSGRLGHASRSAFTLLEAIMVCLIGAVVLGAAISLMVSSQAWTKSGSDHATSMLEVRTALARIARDVRESRMVLYPGAGRVRQPGLGLIDGHGQAVFYRLVESNGAQALVRQVAKEPDAQREILLRRVGTLAVGVADPGGGREPALVRILIHRPPEGQTAADSGVTLFTSASSRAVLSRCLATRGEEP